MAGIFHVFATLRTPRDADALMVGFVRRGMTVSPVNAPVTHHNPHACLLAVKVTAQNTTGRSEDVINQMQTQVQEILEQVPAPWFSIVVVYNSTNGVFMQFDGPSPVNPSLDPVPTQRPADPSPASPLDRMDTAFGDDK